MTKVEIKNLKKDLKPGMLKYMEYKDPGKSESTYTTYVSDSNYLLNNDAVDEYLRFMRSDEDMLEIRQLILDKLVEKRGLEKGVAGIDYYYEKLCWHREYVRSTGGIDEWLKKVTNGDVLVLERKDNRMLNSNKQYKFLNYLGNKETVCLMEDMDAGMRVVRKQVDAPAYEIYQKIKGVDNPNVTKVLDCVSGSGKFFVFEEYISGKTIRSMVEEEGSVPEEKVIFIVEQILNGLSAVHEIGIVHKDIKPENIIIDHEGTAHIVDFGISRIYKEGKTRDTQCFGTPGFLSPEHIGIGHHQTDERSDVFCVGLLCNYMLTGQEDTDSDSKNLKVVIKRATDLNIRFRYQNAKEMRDALNAVIINLKIQGGMLQNDLHGVLQFDKGDISRNIMDNIIKYMAENGIAFSSINLEDSSSYAIMPSKSSVGYRRKEGIVLYLSKDEIDRDCIMSRMGKTWQHNNDRTRPFKFVFSKEEFPEAVRCLTMNPDNCF